MGFFFLLGLIGLLMCTDGKKLNNRRLHSVQDNFTSDLNNYQSAELMNESARCRVFRKLYDNCWTILHFWKKCTQSDHTDVHSRSYGIFFFFLKTSVVLVWEKLFFLGLLCLTLHPSGNLEVNLRSRTPKDKCSWYKSRTQSFYFYSRLFIRCRREWYFERLTANRTHIRQVVSLGP